ncbi:hypothetical protein J120_03385 [candidate division TM6 bacterium JCVI TM6SC1]|uniref:Uncharacterized protein n=1 Tax=candidate division TM6 bacterium JCVI TM6SC1 TaxID=1306947 RepID=A0A0D2JE60_9BACT|nr:hypothetical protein J120_03385 [candidate division TM6 bacterium JCVI TM6SC1]
MMHIKKCIIIFSLVTSCLIFSMERCYIKSAPGKQIEITKATYDALLAQSEVLRELVKTSPNSFELSVYTDRPELLKDIANYAVTGKLPEYAYKLEKNNIKSFVYFTKSVYNLKMYDALKLCGLLWCKFFDSCVENKSIDDTYDILKKFMEKYKISTEMQQKYFVPIFLERVQIRPEDIICESLTHNISTNYINRLCNMGINACNIIATSNRSHYLWRSSVFPDSPSPKINIFNASTRKNKSYFLRSQNFLSDFIITQDGAYIAVLTEDGLKVWEVNRLRNYFDEKKPNFIIPLEIDRDYATKVYNYTLNVPTPHLSISSNNRWMSVYSDKSIYIIDCQIWQLKATIAEFPCDATRKEIVWCDDVFFIQYWGADYINHHIEKRDISGKDISDDFLQKIKGHYAQFSSDRTQLFVVERDKRKLLIYDTADESLLYEINDICEELSNGDASGFISLLPSKDKKFIAVRMRLNQYFYIIDVEAKTCKICHDIPNDCNVLTWTDSNTLIYAGADWKKKPGIFDPKINKTIAYAKNPLWLTASLVMWSPDNKVLNIIDERQRSKPVIGVQYSSHVPHTEWHRDALGRNYQQKYYGPGYELAYHHSIQWKDNFLVELHISKVSDYIKKAHELDMVQVYTIVKLIKEKPDNYERSIVSIVENTYISNAFLRYLDQKAKDIKNMPDTLNLSLESWIASLPQ